MFLDTDTTKNMISRQTLKNFKQGSILINYARGEVVDLDALKTAFEEPGFRCRHRRISGRT